MEFSRNTLRHTLQDCLGDEGYIAFTPNWSIDVYIAEELTRNTPVGGGLGIVVENPRIITKLSDESNIWGCRLTRIQRAMEHFGTAMNDAFEAADAPRNIALEESSGKFRTGVADMLRRAGHFGKQEIVLGNYE